MPTPVLSPPFTKMALLKEPVEVANLELAAELQLLPVEPTDPEVDCRQPSARVEIESP